MQEAEAGCSHETARAWAAAACALGLGVHAWGLSASCAAAPADLPSTAAEPPCTAHNSVICCISGNWHERGLAMSARNMYPPVRKALLLQN